MIFQNLDKLIEEIKLHTPISDVAEKLGIELTCVGNGRYKSFSIFNEERTPSMMYKDDGNMFKDFSSGNTGDVLDLIGAYCNMDLFESIEKYADLTGFNLSAFKRELTMEEKINEELYKTTAEAQRLFVKSIDGKALQYLYDRGLTDATITDFGIGYAPMPVMGNTIASQLPNAVSLQLNRCDVFGDAITLPLADKYGRVWSFQTRPFNSIFGAKYTSVNTDHPLFPEYRAFGLSQARKIARENNDKHIVLTEGAFDCLMACQNGIPTIACLGTNNITDKMYEDLRSCKFKEVVLCLDGDEAGMRASQKHAESFIKGNYGMDMRIVTLPNGLDLCDAINTVGVAVVNELIDNSVFAEEYVLNQLNGTEFEKLNRGVDLIKTMANPVGRAYGIKTLARLLGYDETLIRDLVLEKQGEVNELVNIESEEIVLSEMLWDENYIYEADVSQDDFYLFRHRQLYELIKSIGNNLDTISIEAKNRKYESITREYLQYLTDKRSQEPEFALHDVSDKSIRRKALQVLKQATNDVQNLGEDIDLVVDKTSVGLYQSFESQQDKKVISSENSIDSLLESIDEARKNGSTLIGYSFGNDFKLLDAYTLGLEKSDLMIVSATSGEGKSMLVSNFITNWVMNNIPVLLFSLEMSEVDVQRRNLSILSGVDYRNTQVGNLNASDYQQVVESAMRLKKAPLSISTTVSDIDEIVSTIKRYHNMGKCEIAVIDYIQLVGSSGYRKSDNKATILGDISRKLRLLALELNIPIIMVAQLNRGAKGELEQSMEQIGESYKLAQDCSVMVSLRSKTDKELETYGIQGGNKALTIAKCRRCAMGTVINLYHDGNTFRLKEV